MDIPQLNIELFAHVFVSTSIAHCIHYSRILSRMFITWLNPLVRPRLHVMKNLCFSLDFILIIYIIGFLDKYSSSDLLPHTFRLYTIVFCQSKTWFRKRNRRRRRNSFYSAWLLLFIKYFKDIFKTYISCMFFAYMNDYFLWLNIDFN